MILQFQAFCIFACPSHHFILRHACTSTIHCHAKTNMDDFALIISYMMELWMMCKSNAQQTEHACRFKRAAP
jgi:hypothetical protein